MVKGLSDTPVLFIVMYKFVGSPGPDIIDVGATLSLNTFGVTLTYALKCNVPIPDSLPVFIALKLNAYVPLAALGEGVSSTDSWFRFNEEFSASFTVRYT